jgi:hypothetical protein
MKNSNSNPKRKTCSCCGQNKPVTAFYKNRSQPDGLGNQCKVCHNASVKKYTKTEKGAQMLNKSQSKYRTKVPPAVYQIRCLIDDRVYIGRSSKPVFRSCQHWTRLQAHCHENAALQTAYNLHGREAFVFEILEAPKPEALKDCERYHIRKAAPNCYNVNSLPKSK